MGFSSNSEWRREGYYEFSARKHDGPTGTATTDDGRQQDALLPVACCCSENADDYDWGELELLFLRVCSEVERTSVSSMFRCDHNFELQMPKVMTTSATTIKGHRQVGGATFAFA